MARNRKRAKERRSRRPAPGPAGRPGVATARAERAEQAEREEQAERNGRDETPGPIEHATPDAELAEAQLAVGRPEYAVEGDDELGTDVTPAGDGAPAPRASTGNRLVNFLQGSWRELQRVQWPDRRQVMQATGVVIGFVIVAGLFLGLADTVASKLVTLILK
ncbi:MAG: preprotein translocase subunit SecE [Solirubrobacteraceae bacterium]